MERKLSGLFDKQKFQQNTKLAEVIGEVESHYEGNLTEEELEWVSAAGDGENGIVTIVPAILPYFDTLPNDDKEP